MRIFAHIEPGMAQLNLDDAQKILDVLLSLDSAHHIITTDSNLADVLVEHGRTPRTITLFMNVGETERANVLPGERIITVRCHCSMADVRAVEGAHQVICFFGGATVIRKLAERGHKTHPILFPENSEHLYDGKKWHLILADWSPRALRELLATMGWSAMPAFVLPHGTTNIEALDLSPPEHVS